MASPLTVARNDYRARPKRSDVATPAGLAEFLFELLAPRRPAVILDPAIGAGALIRPWWRSGAFVVGCDVDPGGAGQCDLFLPGPFEGIREWPHPQPALVLCNPPWNGAPGGRLYPEVFLRHLAQLFGRDVPAALFAPMGFRLNQRRRSARWRWLRDEGPALTSILSLPLDAFPGVEFHAEVLFFNLPGLTAHLWLPEQFVG